MNKIVPSVSVLPVVCLLSVASACSSNSPLFTSLGDAAHADAGPVVVVEPAADTGGGDAATVAADDAGDETAAPAFEARDAGAGAEGGGAEGGPAASGDAAFDAGALTCPAGRSVCSAACVDTANDAENCGACGHVCTPGTCAGGTCQPWLVASSNAEAIAVDGSNVVWARTGTTMGVYEEPTAGVGTGSIPLVLGTTTGAQRVDGLVVWNGRVIVASTDPSSLVANLWGAEEATPMSNKSLYSLPAEPGGLALSNKAGLAYFNATDGTYVSVWGCPIAGIETAPLPCSNVSRFAGSSVGGIVADDDAVYWADPSNAQVSRYVFATSLVSAVAAAQLGVRVVAVDGSNVYWAAVGSSGTTLYATPKQSPGTPATLAVGLGSVQAMVSDGVHLYFVHDASAIGSMPVTGGSFVDVCPAVTGSNRNIDSLAYGGGAIYWGDSGVGQVRGLRVGSVPSP